MKLSKILEGIFYRLRNSGPWSDISSDYGPYQTIYGWYRTFARMGLFQKILRLIAQGSRGQLRLVDGTFIQVHQCAANPKGGAEQQQMGKTKGGRNTKVMAMVDARGLPVALLIVPGQAYEGKYVVELVTQEGAKKSLIIVGDKAYDDDKLRSQLEELGLKHCFPTRCNRKESRPMHRGHYRKRYRVENFFCQLKRWASTATRRDKLAENFFALVSFASIIEWLKQ